MHVALASRDNNRISLVISRSAIFLTAAAEKCNDQRRTPPSNSRPQTRRWQQALYITNATTLHVMNASHGTCPSTYYSWLNWDITEPFMGTLKPHSRDHYTAVRWLVHWLLMGGLLHMVQQRGASTGCGPAQSPPRRTKCNRPHQQPVYQLHIIRCGTTTAIALWRVKPIPHWREDQRRVAVVWSRL